MPGPKIGRGETARKLLFTVGAHEGGLR
jgi:hypothetical protein